MCRVLRRNASVPCDSEGSLDVPKSRLQPKHHRRGCLSSSTLQKPAPRFIPRHSQSFVTTSAQNFAKGPLCVAFKSTNNCVQRRPRHHEFEQWQLVCSQWLCTRSALANAKRQPCCRTQERTCLAAHPSAERHNKIRGGRARTSQLHTPETHSKSAAPAGTRWPSRSLH